MKAVEAFKRQLEQDLEAAKTESELISLWNNLHALDLGGVVGGLMSKVGKKLDEVKEVNKCIIRVKEKKPLEAIEVTVENIEALKNWLGYCFRGYQTNGYDNIVTYLNFMTPGPHELYEVAACQDNWIVKTATGQFIKCTHKEFESKYEKSNCNG